MKISKELVPLINKEKNRPSNPLLLQVNEEKYLNSDLKVMIFGQETNSWDKVYHGKMERLFKVDNDFFLKEYCYTYGRYFWNCVASFKKSFEKSYPNKKIILIWNKITKIGLVEKKGNPTLDISKIEHDFFSCD